MSNGSSRWLSPLRYPGGKAVLGEFVGHLIASNSPKSRIYLEPFAGGAGVALYLLFHEYVDRIVLNDLDAGVTAFWRSVFERPDELADLVMRSEVSVEAWHEHWQVYKGVRSDDLQLGFATLFLNRTNRSGILTARPIGGLGQSGRWRIDARFNRKDLVARIRRLARYRNRVEVRHENAVDLLADVDLLKSWDYPFIYADPPYLSKSGDLYLNNVTWQDHIAIAKLIAAHKGPWVVTYDHDERVRTSLYPSHRCAEFSLSHSAAAQHFGQEYMVFSESLRVETLESVGPHGGIWTCD